MSSWIWIEDGLLSGERNMKLDLEALQQCEAGNAVPLLRLYGWDRPTLSVGHFQDVQREVNLESCRERNVPVVRRPTGGRALFHHRELTYALVAPVDHLQFVGGLKKTYEAISRALIQGLRNLGVEGATCASQNNRDPRKGRSGRSPLCFASLNHCEISVDGRKLVGSAQKRMKHAFLQHGSILIENDFEEGLDLMQFSDEDSLQINREHLRNASTCLNRLKGRAVTWEEAAHAILSGFQQIFSGEWTQEKPSSSGKWPPKLETVESCAQSSSGYVR